MPVISHSSTPTPETLKPNRPQAGQTLSLNLTDSAEQRLVQLEIAAELSLIREKVQCA